MECAGVGGRGRRLRGGEVAGGGALEEEHAEVDFTLDVAEKHLVGFFEFGVLEP